ncbi:hypothetical protein [Marmoricola endophyticus]|nr:hypothetical protein [Marmoricola endophyticus]
MTTSRLTRTATATAATTVLLGLGAGAAHAARSPQPATGTTTLQFGGPALKPLTSNGCGGLTATASGDATVRTTGAGKFQANLGVTRIVYTDAGNSRIEHAGSSITLSNSCYEVTFAGFFVGNLGNHNSVVLDVTAKTRSSDESGRRLEIFRLDASGATTSVLTRRGTTQTRTTSMNLLLGTEGARELNQLVTGSEDTGPFVTGQQLGKGRTTVKVPATAMVSTVDTTPPPAQPAPGTTPADPPATGDPTPSDPPPADSGATPPTEG